MPAPRCDSSLRANAECKPDGQPILAIPGSACITLTDAQNHDLLGPIVTDRIRQGGSDLLSPDPPPRNTPPLPTDSELVGLTLWVMAERSRGASSGYAALVQSLPATTLSPLTWPEAKRQELLRGSPCLAECESRLQVLEQQWRDIESIFRMVRRRALLPHSRAGGGETPLVASCRRRRGGGWSSRCQQGP